MSELPKSIDRLDNLLLFIVGSSFVVPTIASAYGLDVRVVWIAVVFYAFWVTIKAFLPGVLLSYRVRIIVDKMKGWSYVAYLGVAFVGNHLMLAILPRTASVLITGVFTMGLVLNIVLALLLRKLFRREVVFMTKEQERKLYQLFQETGSASIFLSVSVLTLSIELLGMKEYSIGNVIFILLVAFALYAYATYRERKASRISRDLILSLVDSGWYERYSGNK